MASQEPVNTAALLHVAGEIGISLKSVVATIALLDEGGTVPFIARYRKEATGSLDEVQIRSIEEQLAYHRELDARRKTVLESIASQGKLTPELEARIVAALEKNELEDLYLPYKPKRRTRASIAREKGLEPLADRIWSQEAGSEPLEEFALSFVNAELGVEDANAAFAGARDILAERISEDAEIRKALRKLTLEEGVVVSEKIEGAADPEGKFAMYEKFEEPAAKIPSHRMLAIRRGSQEEILRFEIRIDAERALAIVRPRVLRAPGEWIEHLERALTDSYQRLLAPSIQTEVRLELKDRSDEEAIRVFRQNLENVLLSPPAGPLAVIGVDPGIRTGCKIAVVDETGKFLENTVIYPLEPRNDVDGSNRVLRTLTEKYRVRAIAIGNGTGSRETAAVVNGFLRELGQGAPFSVVVNESGASVYSASDIARQEFPDLDLTVRGAISIARRLQDPLAELVKIDPKSIGVGQYQHDVDQRRLKQGLEGTVESCVNRVGVDLNTASFALLRYVAGISERVAVNIVARRDEHGPFRSRWELLQVSGFGPKTFEQAAGFLRIRGADHPLDSTAVHPEAYEVVERIAASLNVPVSGLIAQPSLLDNVNLAQFQEGNIGLITLGDIREELKKPGRDPRQQFVAPKLRDDVREIADLKPGMTLEGTVTNVTRFGAFVDLGVHQDGLVHVSELSRQYVQDPATFVKAGQIVKVQVLTADPKAKRIALSMKALEPEPAQTRVKGGKPQQQQSKPPIEKQLAALADRFRTR